MNGKEKSSVWGTQESKGEEQGIDLRCQKGYNESEKIIEKKEEHFYGSTAK